MAFAGFYEYVLPTLSGFAFNLLKSDVAVQEVIQESLIRLWLHRDTLTDIAYPRTWFFTIVTNECFRYLKKNGLNSRLVNSLNDQVATGIDRTTELELSVRETQRLIHQAVELLSDRQRQIYRLSRDQGLPHAVIAAQLGVSTNYVRKTITLALELIRQRLREAGVLMSLLAWWIR